VRTTLGENTKIYESWSRQSMNRDNYTLSAIQVDQIENIRLWRNAQKDVLRQSQDITRQEQKIDSLWSNVEFHQRKF
jgi:anion-transporting  ArsA/GET3 family ATPase